MLLALLIDSIFTRSAMLLGSSKLGVAKISEKYSKALSTFLSRKPTETNRFSFLSKMSYLLEYLSTLTSSPLVQLSRRSLKSSYL